MADEDTGNASVIDAGLKYYIFDWDDNVLHMPTTIILERRGADGLWEPHEVSTALFALIRNDTLNYRPPGGDWESAFANFRDFKDRKESAFLIDTRVALAPIIHGEKEGAPCFHKFKRALIEGRIFGIVTARGHHPRSIRAGVEYFIGNVLSQEEREEMIRNLREYHQIFGTGSETPSSDEEILEFYLSINKYHGVTSPEFQEHVLGKTGAGSENPEEAKQMAIRDFVYHVFDLIKDRGIDKPVSIGFSDDDKGNVAAVQEYIEECLAIEFPDVTFVVFDTSDPEVPDGRKIVLQGQLELGFDS